MMKKTLLIFSILLFCMFKSLTAQDLHIYYNAETSMIKYVLDGEEIKLPKVRKDANIFLHVENYNNYIYTLEVNTNNQLLQIPSGSGLGSFISLPGSSGGTFTGDFNSGANGGYVDIIDGGGEFDDEDGGQGFATEEGVDDIDESELAAFQVLYAEYEGILNNMEKKEAAFLEIQQEAVGIGKRREFRSIGLEEIQKIKWNPNFSPHQIKRMSYEFLNKILEIKDTSQLTLDYIIKKGDDQQELSKTLTKLDKNSKGYNQVVNDLGMFSEKIKNVDLTFDEFYVMQTKAAESL